MTGGYRTQTGFRQLADMGKAIAWIETLRCQLLEQLEGDNEDCWPGVDIARQQPDSGCRYISGIITEDVTDIYHSDVPLVRAREIFLQRYHAQYEMETVFHHSVVSPQGKDVPLRTRLPQLLPDIFPQYVNDELSEDQIAASMHTKCQIYRFYTRVNAEILYLLGGASEAEARYAFTAAASETVQTRAAVALGWIPRDEAVSAQNRYRALQAEFLARESREFEAVEAHSA